MGLISNAIMIRHNLLPKALSVAIGIAREAGAYVKSEIAKFSREQASEKGPNDFVTHVDRRSEEMIKNRLNSEFPELPIVCEESGGKSGTDGDYWLVDPLDGTTNFIHGLPFFCVSIALASGGRPEIGVIYDPMHDELFASKRDEGVWLNDQPIEVSSNGDFGKCLIVTGIPAKFKDQAGKYLEAHERIFNSAASMRRTGSAALDLSYVACGRFDGYWEPFLSPWDMAAGVLLVETAGGAVSDEHGQPWTLDSKGIIAANLGVHAELLKLIKG